MLCALMLMAAYLGTPPPPGPPRLVSLSPTATEIVFALGKGDQVVGVTRYDDHPPEVRRLPQVGGLVDVELEALVALRPSLVLCIRTAAANRLTASLRRLKISFLLLDDHSLADLDATIGRLGEAVGAAAAADRLRERLHDALASGCGRVPTATRAAVVVGRRPLVLAGPGSFYDELLARAGSQNVLTHGGAFARVDDEALVKLDPDVVVDLAQSEGGDAQAFWQRHPAVRAQAQGRVRIETDPRLLRLGPRLAEAMPRLCAALAAPPR